MAVAKKSKASSKGLEKDWEILSGNRKKMKM